jgi:hypothetical protein
MEYVLRSHRFAKEIIRENKLLGALFQEITDAIESLTDEILIETFEKRALPWSDSKPDEKNWMSLSYAINMLLDDALTKQDWNRQSPIFQGAEYKSIWTLDFSKQVEVEVENAQLSKTKPKKVGFAVEVAFNHGEAIAWNLMKPVLAAEVNHLEKKLNVDAGIGVMIVATNELQEFGAFDGAIGTFERVEKYLVPMQNQLTVPIMLIGLKAPEKFRVVKQLDPITRKNKGVIELIG